MHALPRGARRRGREGRASSSATTRRSTASCSPTAPSGPVTGVRARRRRASSTADAVVGNPDLPVAYRTLLPGTSMPPRGPPRARTRRRASLWARRRAGRPAARRPRTTTSTSARTGTARSGRSSDDGVRMPDPSILVTRARRSTTRRWRPTGCHALYVLEPRPNLDGTVDWTTRARAVREPTCVGRVAALGYPTDVEVEELLRPARLGGAWAWSGARRSRWPTRSARPARSGPATSNAGRPGWCSPARGTRARRRRADGARLGQARRRAGRRTHGGPMSGPRR